MEGRAEGGLLAFVARRPGVGRGGCGGGQALRCAAVAARAREEEGHGGSYIRLYRAMDQGTAVPRQDWWRGRPLPRQRSALLVAATSTLCRASMHGAA